jgi:hypothetical protein
MQRFATPSLIAFAAALTFASPALAGDKNERATAAIAAAQAKIDAANKIGAASATPRVATEATAELARAKDAQTGGHKDEAIALALHAGELADHAFAAADQAKTDDAAAATAQAAASADAAQQAAADANARAAAAEAAAAKPAPAPVIIQQAPPAQPTTITTETTAAAAPAPAKVVTKKVVRKPVHRASTTTSKPAAVAVKTTTTVGN